MHATIHYVMGTHDHAEQWVMTLHNDDDEQVMVCRFLTADHDNTPGFNGALESAWQVASSLTDDIRA